MKVLTATLLLTFLLLLVACGGGYGSSNNSNAVASINGNWTTTVSNPSGAQMVVFTSAISQSGTYNLTATNLQFTTGAPCFSTGASGSGALMPSGSTNSFGMTIQSENTSGAMGSTVLTLQGALSNSNSISGSWTINSITPGCSGSGTFTMTKM